MSESSKNNKKGIIYKSKKFFVDQIRDLDELCEPLYSKIHF